MFEFWTQAECFKIYASYLATTERVSEIHYNETVVMPDRNERSGWAHV